MGSARWSPSDWQTHQTQTQHQTQQQIFSSTSMKSSLDPLTIKFRESVDSEQNPSSTPLIVAVDHTGSMGVLAETIIKHGLGVIMEEVYDRKPIHDPHVLCAAVGDAFTDTAPLQVTQFEASIVLAEQVKDFYIEHNGGGNGGESYPLVWYFAAFKTKCDSQSKRSKKGYLFTIGDEPPHLTLTKDQIKRVFGDDVERDFTAKDLLDVVSQNWEVFHLIVNPGSYPKDRWVDLLGERAISIKDHDKLAEVIVSTLQIIEGEDVDAVASSWSGNTALVVRDAVGALATRAGSAGGVTAL